MEIFTAKKFSDLMIKCYEHINYKGLIILPKDEACNFTSSLVSTYKTISIPGVSHIFQHEDETVIYFNNGNEIVIMSPPKYYTVDICAFSQNKQYPKAEYDELLVDEKLIGGECGLYIRPTERITLSTADNETEEQTPELDNFLKEFKIVQNT